MNCDRCHRPATGTYNGRPACGDCLTAPGSRPELPVQPDPPCPPVAPIHDGNSVTLYSLFPGLTDGNLAEWSAQEEAEREERARLIAVIERGELF